MPSSLAPFGIFIQEIILIMPAPLKAKLSYGVQICSSHFTLQTLWTFQLYELIYITLNPIGSAEAVTDGVRLRFGVGLRGCLGMFRVAISALQSCRCCRDWKFPGRKGLGTYSSETANVPRL